ncbi:putative LRR receptor-like serine/threonine-protein kinase [Dorcoceras hygrometricum]|uniref:Putative LRR receptor-like serine/threonine-protein kinase n=1 Tax=Dorcoceras hygrometricum TaxID=472368 RepID=A0A2Z6ZUM0_9LAMI|nr:putative LRR receptor-like serine/threonine-protein kinase [Dorcoceras hygrometricum]
MISAVAQRQNINPVASYSASSRSTMKRCYTSRLNCKGAKTRRRKETAVARSVVTKRRQQLSEHLLNNLLKNIQLLDAINVQDGKIQWLSLSRASCLELRSQRVYYFG